MTRINNCSNALHVAYMHRVSRKRERSRFRWEMESWMWEIWEILRDLGRFWRDFLAQVAGISFGICRIDPVSDLSAKMCRISFNSQWSEARNPFNSNDLRLKMYRIPFNFLTSEAQNVKILFKFPKIWGQNPSNFQVSEAQNVKIPFKFPKICPSLPPNQA